MVFRTTQACWIDWLRTTSNLSVDNRIADGNVIWFTAITKFCKLSRTASTALRIFICCTKTIATTNAKHWIFATRCFSMTRGARWIGHWADSKCNSFNGGSNFSYFTLGAFLSRKGWSVSKTAGGYPGIFQCLAVKLCWRAVQSRPLRWWLNVGYVSLGKFITSSIFSYRTNPISVRCVAWSSTYPCFYNTFVQEVSRRRFPWCHIIFWIIIFHNRHTWQHNSLTVVVKDKFIDIRKNLCWNFVCPWIRRWCLTTICKS